MTRKQENDAAFAELEEAERRVVAAKRKIEGLQSMCPHDWGEVVPVKEGGHNAPDWQGYHPGRGMTEPRQVWVPERVVGHKRVCRLCRLSQAAKGYDEQVVRTPKF